MGCLKCGEATQENRVFCDACMEIMQQYPVKQETAIQLPRRESPPAERKPAPLRETTSKQLARLRSLVRGLLVVIVILSVLLCLVGIFLIRTLN